MSGKWPRCVQRECHPGRRTRFACADVREEGEMCAVRVEYTAYNGDCLRRCRWGKTEGIGQSADCRHGIEPIEVPYYLSRLFSRPLFPNFT